MVGSTHLKQYGHRSFQRRVEALRRLNLIEGQVRGVHRMVFDDRYCVDVLTQILTAREALRQVGMVVLRNYLEVCATKAIREGDSAIYDELITVINRYEHER